MMNYRIFDINNIVKIKEWNKFFSNCPRDPYVKEGFRYKSLSWHQRSHTNFQLLPHYPLFQKKIFNPVHGDINRNYSPIENELIHRADYNQLLNKFSNVCQIKDNDIILVQLQRVDCHSQQHGVTALEGFHRDGIDWLGIFVISRNNIIGGKTQVKDEFDHIIFDQIIPEGHLLILNDRKLLHYSTPIESKKNTNYGFRDVVLITACSKNLIGNSSLINL